MGMNTALHNEGNQADIAWMIELGIVASNISEYIPHNFNAKAMNWYDWNSMILPSI